MQIEKEEFLKNYGSIDENKNLKFESTRKVVIETLENVWKTLDLEKIKIPKFDLDIMK